MERIEVAEVRSASCGERANEIGVQSFQLGEGFQRLMSAPPETGASFTALLGLLENQSTTLLPSLESDETPAELSGEVWSNHGSNHHQPYHLHPLNCTQSDTGLLDQVSRFPVLAATDNSPETSSIPSNSSTDLQKVKQEPVQSDSNADSSPIVSDLKAPDKTKKSTKRKEREKKVKGSTKKSKNLANATSDDGEKLPYVHVRARRGEATDSHSLAERARREKINARMKLLQELVPGCNKISGTALVLDEIINHVQSLQRQVEFLSMRLAAVNPRIDFNLGSLLAPENGSLIDSNLLGGVMPLMRPEGQVNENRQHYQQPWNFEGLQQPVWGREEDDPSFVTPETSLFSYNSSANSAPLHSSQLKMEL